MVNEVEEVAQSVVLEPRQTPSISIVVVFYHDVHLLQQGGTRAPVRIFCVLRLLEALCHIIGQAEP